QTRLEQVKRNVPDTEGNETDNSQAADDKHEQVPRVPGGSRFDVFLTIDHHRHEFGPRAESEVRGVQLAFEKGNPVLMSSGLLPILLPFDRVVMQEQGAVVMFDLVAAAGIRIFKLILNEFKVN